MKCNVFYSTFTNVFFILVTFFTFLTIKKFNLNVFLHLWAYPEFFIGGA